MTYYSNLYVITSRRTHNGTEVTSVLTPPTDQKRALNTLSSLRDRYPDGDYRMDEWEDKSTTTTPDYCAAESKARDLLSGEPDFGTPPLRDADRERLHRLTVFIMGVNPT